MIFTSISRCPKLFCIWRLGVGQAGVSFFGTPRPMLRRCNEVYPSATCAAAGRDQCKRPHLGWCQWTKTTQVLLWCIQQDTTNTKLRSFNRNLRPVSSNVAGREITEWRFNRKISQTYGLKLRLQLRSCSSRYSRYFFFGLPVVRKSYFSQLPIAFIIHSWYLWALILNIVISYIIIFDIVPPHILCIWQSQH